MEHKIGLGYIGSLAMYYHPLKKDILQRPWVFLCLISTWPHALIFFPFFLSIHKHKETSVCCFHFCGSCAINNPQSLYNKGNQGIFLPPAIPLSKANVFLCRRILGIDIHPHMLKLPWLKNSSPIKIQSQAIPANFTMPELGLQCLQYPFCISLWVMSTCLDRASALTKCS